MRQWLILLARMMAVTGLVLVFCQPFIPAKSGGSGGDAAAIDVLVDKSFSMQREGDSQVSLFEKAVAAARTIGNPAFAGAKLRLLGDGASGLAPSAYQAKLDRLRMSTRGSFDKVVAKTDGGKNPLYVISDFQKNSFDINSGNLPDKQEVLLLPLAGKKRGNLYVDSLWFDDAFVRVRTNAGVQVRVKNGGEATVRDGPVKVFLGARQVATFRVTVEPGQAVTRTVQLQVPDNRLALGRVVTEDAPVTFDNTYYFTLQPAADIRVVEIGPTPLTQQVYGNEPLFVYSFSQPQRVDYGALRQANLVLVREVAELDAGLREALKALVKRGGSVVVVPSAPGKSRASYQQLFRELGLGTVQWEAGAGESPELREVAMPNAHEPFFRDVFGARQRAVAMPRVAPVLRWARTGTDIMRLRGGESYLARFASGAGQVYVFSAPFAAEYSDFAAHALFVPVMYRLAMLSYRTEQLPAYRLTQNTVTLPLPPAVAAEAGGADAVSYRLVKDSLTLIPAQRVLGQDVRLDLPAGMESPGFYQVQRRGKAVTTLAFNQDKKESELAAYSADELRRLVGTNHPNVRVVEAGDNGAGLAKFQAGQTGQPLWRYFLALALLCLLAEALLVRFGHKRATAAARKAAA